MSACHAELLLHFPHVFFPKMEAWYVIPGSNYFLVYGAWVFISYCHRPPATRNLPNRLHLPDCTVTHCVADSYRLAPCKEHGTLNM